MGGKLKVNLDLEQGGTIVTGNKAGGGIEPDCGEP